MADADATVPPDPAPPDLAPPGSAPLDPAPLDAASLAATTFDPASFGADEFRYHDGDLWCEQRRVSDLAAHHGTPLYVYSRAAMVGRYRRLRQAFGPDAHVCFAVKSNSNLSLLRLFGELGAGFDLVSEGELRRLQAAGVPTGGSVFAGVGKEGREIEAALAAGILFFNLETPYEVELMQTIGARMGRQVNIAVRLNPDVEAHTHAYIATGKRENKFGIGLDAAADVVRRIGVAPNLQLVGYHVHLGSQLRHVEPYLTAFDRVTEFMDAAPERRAGVRYYDMGGGFAVSYGKPGGTALDVERLARELRARVAARGLQLVLEPGRYLVADAGILVVRVLGEKVGTGRSFLLVDGAMNDLLRPALYQAEHPVAPVRRDRAVSGRGQVVSRKDVVGPVCESGDFLARDRDLPQLARGDLLAVFAAGAYGASMASNYNSRRRPAEVLVSGTEARLIRRRERYEDLWAQELEGELSGEGA